MTHPFQPHSLFPSPGSATARAAEILSVSIFFPLGEMRWFLVAEASLSLRCILFFALLADEIIKSWNGKAALKLDECFPAQQSFLIRPWA